MNLAIELEQETDGRWIAEVDKLDGVLVYGETREDAIKKVKTLALRVIADRLENGESLPQQIKSFEREKPYRTTLKNGIWTVSGSLPEGMDGGVAMVAISQKDGKVLKVIHGK